MFAAVPVPPHTVAVAVYSDARQDAMQHAHHLAHLAHLARLAALRAGVTLPESAAPVLQPQAPSQSPVSLAPAYGAVGGSFGACVRLRENSNSYAWGTGNGGGAYQFEPATWAQFAPPGAVWGQASPAQQDQAFMNAVSAGDSSAWSTYDGC